MIYCTADTHFGHKNIIKYCNRPFQNIEEMDEELIYQTNRLVKLDDILIHGGDFAIRNIEKYRAKIHCKNIIFVYGNHDKKSKNIYNKAFSQTHNLYEFKYQGQTIVVCHYAMAVWNKSHYGSIHLYGHSHSESEKFLDNALGKDRKSMDIGVDNIAKLFSEYRPINMDEVLGIMLKKKGKDCRGR